jgi:hypothetical protein
MICLVINTALDISNIDPRNFFLELEGSRPGFIETTHELQSLIQLPRERDRLYRGGFLPRDKGHVFFPGENERGGGFGRGDIPGGFN